MATSNPHLHAVLGDPALRRDLAQTVRRRLDRVEVDDVVQAALVEALAAKAAPTVEEEIRRFVFSIARQKVADHYRRKGREDRKAVEVVTRVEPDEDLKLWAERTVPHGAEKTFEWMLREAEGETLAEIAVADQVTAPMVRQRVSRLRRWLRARWTKELGAFALLSLVATIAALAHRGSIARSDTPTIRAEAIGKANEPLTALPQRILQKSPPPVTPPPPADAPVANVAEVTRSHLDGTGHKVYERVLEVTLPKLNVSSCRTPTSPRGVSVANVTFSGDGTAQSVVVTGVSAGRPEAACIERLYMRVRTRRFANGPATGAAYFELVPAARPAWLAPPP